MVGRRRGCQLDHRVPEVNAMYTFRIIVDRLPIDLVEVGGTDEERVLRVTRGIDSSWEIVLTRWYAPSVSLLPNGNLAVWASTRLFLLTDGCAPHRLDLDDEVHAVFLAEDYLLVVAELSVLLIDVVNGEVEDRIDAEDVLGRAWWEGDNLHVEQWNSQPLVFRPRNGRLRLVREDT